jgi:quercetin dioxygenase-like cupin family protein
MTNEKQRVGLHGRKLHSKLLTFRLDAQDDELHARAKDAAEGRASRTLVKQGSLRITQVALRKGAALESHHVAGALSIQVLRGTVRLTTDEGDTDLAAGSLATLAAGVVHAARGLNNCALLLTISLP